MLQLRLERETDDPVVEALLDAAFGPERRRKISYRYREGIERIAALCWIAEEAERIVGTIRYWPIRLAETPALLLGPVATDPSRRATGIGRALVFETLARAADLGWTLVFLVGDEAYYRRFGFARVPANVVMPGEDPARVQWRGLGGVELPPSGGELLRADGTRIEPAQSRLTDRRKTLVSGYGVGRLPQPSREGGSRSGPACDLFERVDVRLDREQHGPGARQTPQGLSLDA